MTRHFLAIFLAVLIPTAIPAQSPGAGFSVFLEERVALIAEDPAIPEEALPSLSLRAQSVKENLLFEFDCDTRNLNPPSGDAPPFYLEFSPESPASETRLSIRVDGDRGTEEVELPVFPVAGEKKQIRPEGITARQITRDDGVRRVTLSIPLGLLAENGMSEQARGQAIWRQLTSYGEDAKPLYAPTGGLVLSLPGTEADFLLRSPLPADVAAMLSMLAASKDERCQGRCLRRLLWVGHRDEALRGALVMALEHADPVIRRSAAKVWTEWSLAETPGLAELKEKAAAILAAPPP